MDGTLLTFFPAVFFHGLHDHDKEESKEVEAFTDIAAGDLEKVLLVERLENTSLYLDKLQ